MRHWTYDEENDLWTRNRPEIIDDYEHDVDLCMGYEDDGSKQPSLIMRDAPGTIDGVEYGVGLTSDEALEMAQLICQRETIGEWLPRDVDSDGEPLPSEVAADTDDDDDDDDADDDDDDAPTVQGVEIEHWAYEADEDIWRRRRASLRDEEKAPCLEVNAGDAGLYLACDNEDDAIGASLTSDEALEAGVLIGAFEETGSWAPDGHGDVDADDDDVAEDRGFSVEALELLNEALGDDVADEPLDVGDVVRLRSGGPLMTIAGVDDETGETSCTYFDDGAPKYFETSLAALERAGSGDE